MSINLLALATGNKYASLDINGDGATPQGNVNTSAGEVSNFFSLEGLTFAAGG